MKKVLKAIFLLVLIIIPLSVKATDYGIEYYYVNATIEENGDLIVEEYFNLNGYFNGFDRVINFTNPNTPLFNANSSSYGGSSLHNGDGIELLEIKALNKSANFNFTNLNGDVFSEVTSAASGDYGVYEKNDNSIGMNLRIYLPSYKNKAFYLKYRIKNMAILHEDIAELGWNVLGNELSESIKNLTVCINIPNNKEVKVWAHGPLNGESKIINSNKVIVKVTNLDAYEAIDVRLAFDKLAIKNSLKKSNVKALDKILVYEEEAAKRANEKRQEILDNAQNEAMSVINHCMEYRSRYCLNQSREYLKNIYDVNLQKEYTEKIKQIELMIIEDEKNRAINDVEMFEENLEYFYYEDALKSVGILSNGTLKNELQNRINIALELLKEKEYKQEQIRCLVAIVDIIIVLSIMYLLYKKYAKNPPVEFNQKYFRDIPSEMSPLTLSYLMYKKVNKYAISAELLNLIRKKKVAYEDLGKKNSTLTLISEEGLNDNEQRVVDLIFYKDKVQLKELEIYASNHYSSYLRKYDKVIEGAERDCINNDFYSKEEERFSILEKVFQSFLNILLIILCLIIFIANPIAGIFIIVTLLLKRRKNKTKPIKGVKWKICINIAFSLNIIFLFIYLIYSTIFSHFNKFSYKHFTLAIIITIICMIIKSSFRKRTTKGALEYAKWKGLYNFLKDFSKIDERELPEVSLWEEYLVYATLFGIAKKVSKSMSLKVKDLETTYDFATISNMYYLNKHIRRAVASSKSRAVSAKTSHDMHSSSGGSSSGGSWSSGSGGGGGFSSGGGSFGGGGGGGRF